MQHKEDKQTSQSYRCLPRWTDEIYEITNYLCKCVCVHFRMKEQCYHAGFDSQIAHWMVFLSHTHTHTLLPNTWSTPLCWLTSDSTILPAKTAVKALILGFRESCVDLSTGRAQADSAFFFWIFCLLKYWVLYKNKTYAIKWKLCLVCFNQTKVNSSSLWTKYCNCVILLLLLYC